MCFATTMNATPIKSCKRSASTDENGRENSAAKFLKLNGPSKHLVLLVHGIGQGLDKDANMDKTLKKLQDALQTARINKKMKKEECVMEIRAVEWRNNLPLEDEALRKCAIGEKIPHLRDAINLGLSDVLYYQDPVHAKSIVTQVSREMNRQYKKFLDEEDLTSCPVSVLAHSLGSVIVYDILTAQSVGFPSQMRGSAPTPDASDKLEFEVDNFFAIGSPLGLFLTIRGVATDRYRKRNGVESRVFSSIPRTVCRHMHNIFHPEDAIAYKWDTLEPTQDTTDNPGMDSEGYDIKLAETKIEIKFLGKVGKALGGVIQALGKVEEALPSNVKKVLDFAKARKAHKFYWKSTKLMETVLDKVFSG
ncbi:uncharacterized protein LOC134191380 [Corticium candelabrum]|uniref:uncharacterized protein LOC134191380 n=1 Tax=Corticium candelabrum TaxID=121492 RepID=UPI002E25AC30|nr:uncharacterized protein LOC134191380 [Corticium candelabrum]